jgi:RNA polymerase sigma factor (sigma-70 family)
MSDDDLEAELVGLAKRGDPSAAPFLVSLCGERLLGYARAHAPDLSDTDRERIVELAIEAGVRAIERFDPARGSLLGWFRGQVRFKTLAWRRSAAPTVELDDSLSAPDTPEVSVETGVIEALGRAIRHLGPDDQEILALRDAEQLEYREIANRLEINEDAVRQRHSRARKRLQTAASAESDLRRYLGEEET